MNKGFLQPKGWATKIATRATKLKRVSGSPRSVFAGDPIEVDESAGAAITAPELIDQVIPAAIVGSSSSEEEAAEKAEQLAQMSQSQRQEVVVLPALVVSNALMVISPNTRPIPADNVNYNFNRALTDYASRGYSYQSGVIQTTEGAAPADKAVVKFCDLNLYNSGQLTPDEYFRYKTVPAFKFTLTASVLRTRPGGQYNLEVSGTTVGDIEVTSSDKIYTFQRLNYSIPVVGLYIPFIIIATRTVAALLKWGNPTGPANEPEFPNYDPTKDVPFTVSASGLAEDETLIVEVPGYTTAMTAFFCSMYGLSAGRYVR